MIGDVRACTDPSEERDERGATSPNINGQHFPLIATATLWPELPHSFFDFLARSNAAPICFDTCLFLEVIQSHFPSLLVLFR